VAIELYLLHSISLENLQREAYSLEEILMGATGMWQRKIDTSPTSDPLVLVVVEGSERRTLVLDHYPFTIGRRTDRDLVMADPRVSREHAQFEREGHDVYIIDQGSRHGTYVNAERVNRRKLTRNDHIEFGFQGGAHVLFSPDRSPTSAAQQFLSQFSTWKPAAGAGSDLEMLNVFLEAARKLNTSGVLDDVLNALLEAALRLTRAERGFVFLRHPDGELRLAAGRGKNGESITDDSGISRSILRDAAASASEFLVTDTDDTGKLAGRESVVAHNLHSVICIPLRKTVIQEKVKVDTKSGEITDVQGVLYLDAHFLSGKLSSVSHDILRTIANGAATLVENASLVQAEDAAKRYRQELAIAAEIQQRLMTVTVPDVPFAKVNAVSYACKDIGGDFFDLVYTPRGLSLIVADVSGKGVSAAVVASTLQGMLYSNLARDASLPEMIAAVNSFLCEKVGGQKYATLVVARITPDGAMELINCGHVPPLLVSDGKVVKLEEGNLPVGLVPGAEYQHINLQLKADDRLLLVTDGVTEAEDAGGEFFGNERLECCCAQGLVAIEQAVTDFRGDTALTDDFTITELIYRG
jgi:sigma-B regulation protein RsbU (phosphoserine phosphatase)